jgi:hypothetical protein
MRNVLFLLLLCAGVAPGSSFPTDATIALVPHFDATPVPEILRQIAPPIAAAFRPAGLSVEWYPSRAAAPANAARTLDIWFHGDCQPLSGPMVEPRLQGVLRLGWVHSDHGRIAGEIVIDCPLVMGFAIHARNASTTTPQLSLVYERLLERVVGHELLHVLLMTATHGKSDFTHAQLYASDWRRNGQLTHAEIQSLRQWYGLNVRIVREADFLSFMSDGPSENIGKLTVLSWR